MKVSIDESKPSNDNNNDQKVNDNEITDLNLNQNVNNESDDSFHGGNENNDSDQINDDQNENLNNNQQNRYDLRDRSKNRQPERYGIPLNFASMFYVEELFVTQFCEPLTFEEAIKDDNSREWVKAMQEEYRSLIENNTWKLVPTPESTIILKNKWVYKIKYNTENNTKIYKARLVVKGYEQRAGIDYNETYSPVARHDSIRAFLSVTASEKMHLKQFDVKTAFLNGVLSEKVYMYQPEGFCNKRKEVCLLLKSIYGLKQAAKDWNDAFVEWLRLFGLYPLDADPCIFISKDDNEIIILTIHVDDGIVASKSLQRINDFILHLQKYIKITICDLTVFLGIELTKMPNGTLFFNQKRFAETIVLLKCKTQIM